MKKFLITSLIGLFLSSVAIADTDGENSLSKKDSGKVKDCFEGLNRATFSLNQGLDKVIFRPVAKGYRSLPSPVRKGTSNALVNLSSLITIPNNVLQGEFKTAGINTGRFVVNTTVGILGIFDVAEKWVFLNMKKKIMVKHWAHGVWVLVVMLSCQFWGHQLLEIVLVHL